MRVIHADLVTAQQSGATDPYIYLSINSTDYSSRLLALEHTEEPYRNQATLILTNSDRHFDSVSLLGKSFTIGYGYVTSSGNRYCGDGDGTEAMPTLWVKSQSQVSMEGKLVCILYCEGGWFKLREHRFITTSDPPHFNIEFVSTDTVYQLIEKALTETGFTLSSQSIDDIIQDFLPIFTANPLSFESPASIIYRLIQMTKCHVREVEASNYEVLYPQTSDDMDETYYSDQAPQFKEYVEQVKLLIPNSIVVFCNRDNSGAWSPDTMITGTASDADSIAAYGEVIEYHTAPYIDNQVDADRRADAILTRLKYEILGGRLLLPYHDARVELYDRVKVWDSRGS